MLYQSFEVTASLKTLMICILTFIGPCIVIYSYNKIQQDALFLNFILVEHSTCFGQTYCPSSGVLILSSILTSQADSQHNL